MNGPLGRMSLEHIAFPRVRSADYYIPVRDSPCTGVLTVSTNSSTWWQTDNLTLLAPIWTEPVLNHTWQQAQNSSTRFITPDGYYFVCGRRAYERLPLLVRHLLPCYHPPRFFLLPISAGETLGVPVYASQGIHRRRSEKIPIGNWSDKDWPPERIVQYYGPATWAEDGSHGYRTPIYMLNRIIRLQVVLELLTNDSAMALKLCVLLREDVITTVYQKLLALDYLLVQEGGVCGKFNLSNCLQIDDQSHVIREITDPMIRLAHVPVQTWTGALYWTDSFSSWFPSLSGLKGFLFPLLLFLGSCLILPLCLPLLLRHLRSMMEAIADRRTAAHLMTLSMYTTVPVNPPSNSESDMDLS
ncbi:endogenous retrovirus group 3 member 1 Env polyprotein-like [Rhinatrema bivittatum]|uniref:endogenous retrovirus group 3 member 1 Env polyprotein-like n=1 Tax=Rhinatrema bivittatum TaxID=194408 RepID=UPI00112B9057|nr:endogenous retrovirus group 3 member 1 Env polyprotein-like [Rhinatrema bivittatum]XP_029456097.1 endogenous retrovirus group 3 member 1 Env polyprotein-like [Rhinatrema bivittatum]XP_029456098.1 endogenous retrovirus group 3 member 1 Env polyprotein-like [Rhinatrema bivittatum]XP_029456099.1 endogenous retrovirus group 3 member 1 Env polyprotein-like [Rhinatrema bivittatum]